MSEDFDGDYGKIALQVIEAGMDDVRIYLDKQQRRVKEVQIENESLMKENNRLQAAQEEMHKYFAEQRKRLKPDGPLVSKKVLLMAVELLVDAEIISNDPWDDWHADYIKSQIDRLPDEDK